MNYIKSKTKCLNMVIYSDRTSSGVGLSLLEETV